LEILLSIAVMALLAGVLLVGASRVLSDQPRTPDEVFWKAVREARKTALRSEHPVELSFDADERSFVITTHAGAKRSLPLAAGSKVSVDFLQASRGAGFVLLGGELVETQKIPQVAFYPDGTCAPFRVQFRGQTGEPWTHAIDPWTCAPVLEAPKT
jgi:general secretion pathway protein H